LWWTSVRFYLDKASGRSIEIYIQGGKQSATFWRSSLVKLALQPQSLVSIDARDGCK
jgi:hypothetical protein